MLVTVKEDTKLSFYIAYLWYKRAFSIEILIKNRKAN